MPKKSSENRTSEFYKLSLNKISEVPEDKTVVEVKFSILTFDVSGNNSVITKEVAEKHLLPTIADKPIVAALHEDYISNEINLGDHEAHFDEDGSLERFTTPLGVLKHAQIETITDINTGLPIEAIVATGVLWKTRYPEMVNLITDWFERGININSSCEILFNNYTMNDGIKFINNPIFEGHCILSSESNEAHQEVTPAYSNARGLSIGKESNDFNLLVAQLIEESHKEDIKLPVEPENLEPVVEPTETVEPEVVLPVPEQEPEKEPEIEPSEDTVEPEAEPEVEPEHVDLSEENLRLKEELTAVKVELSQTNEQLNALSEIKEKYDAEVFSKKVADLTVTYSEKFSKINAPEQVESDEVKGLINELASGNIDAKSKLADIILDSVDSLSIELNSKSAPIVQAASKMKTVVAEHDYQAKYFS